MQHGSQLNPGVVQRHSYNINNQIKEESDKDSDCWQVYMIHEGIYYIFIKLNVGNNVFAPMPDRIEYNLRTDN